MKQLKLLACALALGGSIALFTGCGGGGDNATLVLTPTTADGVSTINLTFANSTSGTYTSDTVGSGSFTVTSNAPSTP